MLLTKRRAWQFIVVSAYIFFSYCYLKQNRMDTKIIKNKELSITEALIPVIALIIMLGYNVLFMVMKQAGVINCFYY
jgi:heme/copper-type cytochrome/quinol oxidase subunit 2